MIQQNGTTAQKFENEERTLNIKTNIELKSIKLNEEKINMIVNTQKNMKVIYNPENTTNSKEIVWSSSDDSIVSVDNNGLIKALSEGIAIITANCNGKKATCEVIVSKELNNDNVEDMNKEEKVDSNDKNNDIKNIINSEDNKSKECNEKNNLNDGTTLDKNYKKNILDNEPKTGIDTLNFLIIGLVSTIGLVISKCII